MSNASFEISENSQKFFQIKIPTMFTNGSSSKKLIEKLINEKVNLNITAIFTLEQIKEIIEPIGHRIRGNNIIDICRAEFTDIGIDATQKFFEVTEIRAPKFKM